MARKFNSRVNAKGQLVPDPRPVEVPAGFRKPESLTERIRRLIRTDVSGLAEKQGAESFEEANDFDVADDDAAESGATHHELHEEVTEEIIRVRREAREKAARAAQRRGADESPSSAMDDYEDDDEGDDHYYDDPGDDDVEEEEEEARPRKPVASPSRSRSKGPRRPSRKKVRR